MKKYILLTILLALFSTLSLQAQNKKVSGTVSDDKGALESVVIVEKGYKPNNGTTTDNNGNFTLTLKGNSNTVLVTSVGFKSMEVKLTGAPLVIKMIVDPRSLSDVVVVGYSKQKKITLTGAVSQVSGNDIRQNPSASLQNGLTGRLPGFFSQQRSGRPGADGAAFFIRGVSSFTGFNEPLIIVDDLEFSYNQFAALDANEVESITILKDASTTAIYGVRGANGVVVVTTRRGKIGTPTISLRTEYATMEPTILPKYLNSFETATLVNTALINDGGAARFTQADLDLFQNGQDPYGHPDVNWKDVLFKKYSHQTRNNLDITGGTERVKYFVSLGYIDQGGILKDFKQNSGVNNNYYNQRFNYRSNLDIKASKDLDIKFDFYGNKGVANTPNIQYSGKGKGGITGDKNDAFYEYSSFYSLSPFAYNIKNPNGTWGYNAWQLNGYGFGVGNGYDAGNIVGRLNEFGYNRAFTDNMRFMTSLNYKLDFITRGLSLKGLASYSSTYSYTRGVTRSEVPAYIYNISTNTYINRDNNITTSGKFNTGYGAGSTIRDLNLQASVNYDRNFSDHHVYGLALLNRTSRTLSTTQNATSNFIPVNFQGITARLGYDYKQKYLFQFNGAYNGTDKFLGDKRYGFFPAVSAGWNIAEEPFFKKAVPVVNLFKIRGSYGIVGSDALNTTEYIFVQQFTYNTAGADLFSFQNPANNRIYTTNFGSSVGSNFVTNLQEGRLANTNITWEKEKKLDVGVDFGLFNNKLTGAVDLFFNNRYDILADRQTVSLIVGQSIPRVNIGETKNRGGEVELAYRGNIGKNFSFTVKGNYSYAKNELVYTDELPVSIYLPAYQRSTGGPIGNPLLYKWSGGFYKDAADIARSPIVKLPGITVRPGDLKYEDIGGPDGKPDGILDAYDRGFFGNPNLPNTNYGFQLNTQYKNFDFNVVFQGAANFNVSAISEAIRPFSSNLQPVHQRSWTPALGDDADFPILTVNRSGISDGSVYNSTFWSRRGDYLRLRTAQVAYTLPKTLVGKLKVKDIRVYVNGNNMFTWSKLFKLYALDPEVSSGTDRTAYPPQRTYNIGLNVTF
jgi:TonB-linked SusC/RagA family outer membrane protein